MDLKLLVNQKYLKLLLFITFYTNGVVIFITNSKSNSLQYVEKEGR